jgi:dTDP-4-amino-4,6-dideoxygalactose transaminase
VWSYKDHGRSYDAVYINDLKPGPSFKWLHESFGTNWRMTEMQAAIGRIQLRKLPDWIEKRRRNVDILTKAFLKIPALRVTMPPKDIKHAYYKYYVFVKRDMLKTEWSREKIITAINAEGIPCFTGSCSEMYLEKAFDADGMRPEKRLPVAEELGDTSMMFLVHPTLSENDMRDMVKAVEKVMAVAVK